MGTDDGRTQEKLHSNCPGRWKGSEPVSAKDLESALGETEGAQGLVFSGKVTDRIHELASGAGINNVVGKTVGPQSLKLGVQAYSIRDLE